MSSGKPEFFRRGDSTVYERMASRTQYPEHVSLVDRHRSPSAVASVFWLVCNVKNPRLPTPFGLTDGFDVGVLSENSDKDCVSSKLGVARIVVPLLNAWISTLELPERFQHGKHRASVRTMLSVLPFVGLQMKDDSTIPAGPDRALRVFPLSLRVSGPAVIGTVFSGRSRFPFRIEIPGAVSALSNLHDYTVTRAVFSSTKE